MRSTSSSGCSTASCTSSTPGSIHAHVSFPLRSSDIGRIGLAVELRPLLEPAQADERVPPHHVAVKFVRQPEHLPLLGRHVPGEQDGLGLDLVRVDARPRTRARSRG